MEDKVSELLEDILGFLGLEGSFEVEEKDEAIFVSIETEEPGKLIGKGGETLAALQLLLNLGFSRSVGEGESKRIIVDISNWRKSREEELAHKARVWAEKVIASGEPMELEPMPSWQRRIVHMTIEGTEGVSSESMGEGEERHLVISPTPAAN